MSGEVPTMQMVIDSIEETITAAVRSWTITVTAEKNRLLASGMSESAVMQLLADNIGTLTGPLAGAKVGIGQAVSQAANTAQHNAYLNAVAKDLGGNIATEKFQWVLDPSADSCDDCIERDNQVKTYAEWQGIGTPGAGGTVCNANCKCVLIPVSPGNK